MLVAFVSSLTHPFSRSHTHSLDLPPPPPLSLTTPSLPHEMAFVDPIHYDKPNITYSITHPPKQTNQSNIHSVERSTNQSTKSINHSCTHLLSVYPSVSKTLRLYPQLVVWFFGFFFFLSSIFTSRSYNAYVRNLIVPSLVQPMACHLFSANLRAGSRSAPSQRETSLQRNAVCHWLGANLVSALNLLLDPMLTYFDYFTSQKVIFQDGDFRSRKSVWKRRRQNAHPCIFANGSLYIWQHRCFYPNTSIRSVDV